MHLAEEKRKLHELLQGSKASLSLMGTKDASEAVSANKNLQM